MEHKYSAGDSVRVVSTTTADRERYGVKVGDVYKVLNVMDAGVDINPPRGGPLRTMLNTQIEMARKGRKAPTAPIRFILEDGGKSVTFASEDQARKCVHELVEGDGIGADAKLYEVKNARTVTVTRSTSIKFTK